jgi:transposase
MAQGARDSLDVAGPRPPNRNHIQSLHRLRNRWVSSRVRYVNTLRGILREFGIAAYSLTLTG